MKENESVTAYFCTNASGNNMSTSLIGRDRKSQSFRPNCLQVKSVHQKNVCSNTATFNRWF